jgi:hypothetical protein
MADPKTFPCPACGEDVPARAKACPHCGADEKSGWRDDETDGLDLPDEDFDYDKSVQEEFGIRKKPKGKWSLIKIVGVVLVVLALIAYVISFTIL